MSTIRSKIANTSIKCFVQKNVLLLAEDFKADDVIDSLDVATLAWERQYLLIRAFEMRIYEILYP